MGAPLSITAQERRAELGRRHGLATQVHSVAAAAEATVVLHATDPATVFLSVAARVHGADVRTVERALYDDRQVIRLLAMRRTLFVASRTVLPLVTSSSTAAVAASERRRLLKFLSESNIARPDFWLDRVSKRVLDALAADGASARELTDRVPELATKITMGRGTKHEVSAGATSRVLGVMAVEGSIMRARPGGSWTARLHRWYRTVDWLGEPLADVDPGFASAELVRRWLHAFGPATLADLKWWTGWTAKQTNAAVAAVGAIDVDLDGRSGLLVPDDPLFQKRGRSDDAEPWAALLPALDPTPMGWKEREWFLGEHRDRLFDRFGNIGPTVWINGRIVGAWAQRQDGEVFTQLLEPVGDDERRLLDARAVELSTFTEGTVVRPSFPTPLFKEMSAKA